MKNLLKRVEKIEEKTDILPSYFTFFESSGENFEDFKKQKLAQYDFGKKEPLFIILKSFSNVENNEKQ